MQEKENTKAKAAEKRPKFIGTKQVARFVRAMLDDRGFLYAKVESTIVPDTKEPTGYKVVCGLSHLILI